ncbi:hypothetical protein SsS58_00771 [Streptomyces scabiei]|uniref:Uncharacterized protein n=1 Tax=Streptomyces scabiei TaxID=1930 RepID=A0A100JJ11_STRSC|nr:hypothetical protein [Streptomyces scabiei]GAQ60431.1 hypothetical protein SsS58_00771 [Streptomyces scabiei]
MPCSPLHAVGFDAAPRPPGLDDQGREVPTFMPGDVVRPDRFSLMGPLGNWSALHG